VSVALADHHDGVAGDRRSRLRDGPRGGRFGDAGSNDSAPRGGGCRAAAASAGPAASGPPVAFFRDEIVEICGALALGGTLLRRLGLDNEAERLEALFGAVERRLAQSQSAAAFSASGS
jgi:hypothetical protein